MSNTLIQKAALFAKNAHAGQSRKFTHEPYFHHVESVAALVAEHGGTQEQIAAAYLHDTMEDCGITHATLSAEFGTDVADLVQYLTNNEELLETLGKVTYMIKKLAALPPDALLIKLCDTLNNITETRSEHQADNYRRIIEGLILRKHPEKLPFPHSELAHKILSIYQANTHLRQ